MFTGPVGPVEVFFYWPKAVLGNFYWPGVIGSPLASSSVYDFSIIHASTFLLAAKQYSLWILFVAIFSHLNYLYQVLLLSLNSPNVNNLVNSLFFLIMMVKIYPLVSMVLLY